MKSNDTAWYSAAEETPLPPPPDPPLVPGAPCGIVKFNTAALAVPAICHARLRPCRSRRHCPHRHRRRCAHGSRSPHRSAQRQHCPLRRRNIRLRPQRSRRCQITRAVEHHHIIRHISRLRHPCPRYVTPTVPGAPAAPCGPVSSRRPRSPRLRQHRPKSRTNIRLSPCVRRNRDITRPAISHNTSDRIRTTYQPRPLKTCRWPSWPLWPLSSRRPRSTSRAWNPLRPLWPRRALRRQQSPPCGTLIRSIPHIPRQQRHPRRPRITHRIMQPIVRP